MNATELATRMLEWETTQRAADALRAEIEAAVLALGKTQTVGNVRATFSAGRRTFDYRAAVDNAEAAGLLAPGSLAPWESNAIDYREVTESAIKDGLLEPGYLTPFTSVNIDYTAAAKGLSLDAPVKSQSEPSVTVKLLA